MFEIFIKKTKKNERVLVLYKVWMNKILEGGGEGLTYIKGGVVGDLGVPTLK